MTFTLLSVVCVLLAIFPASSFYESAIVRLVAVLSVVTSTMLWLNSCYAAYALAVVYFLFLVGIWLPFNDPDYHTLLESTIRSGFSVVFLVGGVRWWTNAGPFTIAQSARFEKERTQVREWISVLKRTEETNQVLEFSAKSFWTGYWKYRLLNAGNYWVIAKSKIGNTERLLDCRVRGLDAIHVTNDRRGGGLNIEMAVRSVRNAEASSICVRSFCTLRVRN